MISARSPVGVRRSRLGAGTSRLWWLGILLLGVLHTHGIGVEGGSGHISPATMTSAVAVAQQDTPGSAADAAPGPASDHDNGEDAPHPGGECLSRQPQDGPILAAPCSPGPDSAAAGANPRGIGSSDGGGHGGHASPDPHQAAILRL
ncbi:DUF6153 family protein [Streptomyces sp. NPDC048479]|uniref:DUF6153 family protein n=1 Tax=Streptomyces sp. NPDC048479 TaxID=3154725 RepID=UPI0034360BC9